MVDVPPEIPPGFFVDWGFWDYNLVIPVWIWIILILVFIGFVGFVCMLYIWFVMRPVSGYNAPVSPNADIKGSPTQVFSIWKNRSFVIETMIYYGNILAYADCLTNMQMWQSVSEKAVGLAANKPVMITRDGFNRTVDLIAEMAICELPKLFNETWGMEEVQAIGSDNKPQFNKVLREDGSFTMEPVYVLQERKDGEGNSYTLRNFTDIYRRLPLLEKLFPNGVPIPIYQLYDLSVIYTFTPKGEDSLKTGGIVVDDAKDWVADNEEEPPSWLARNAPIILIGIVCMIGTVFVYYAFP